MRRLNLDIRMKGCYVKLQHECESARIWLQPSIVVFVIAGGQTIALLLNDVVVKAPYHVCYVISTILI